MKIVKKYIIGILLTMYLAYLANFLSSYIPQNLISPGVFALLIGMALNPMVERFPIFKDGITFSAKTTLKLAIILMGATLSFRQVLSVGKYSLIVMVFTLATAFGSGHYIGKLFKLDWKLTSLISAGTGVCGGSAIAAIAPTIEAKNRDVAYAISATFLFDIIMVILFPIAGRFFQMTDLGFGLWTGTAVNDTSSVVAAGYAFSDAAGNFALIVKLTRTLSIVPIVLIFAYINTKKKAKDNKINTEPKTDVNIMKIFPWFIFLFIFMVSLRSVGLIPDGMSQIISTFSKFGMVMALAAIGLNTNFKEVSKSGILPMVHGFLISVIVVIVSLLVQVSLGIL